MISMAAPVWETGRIEPILEIYIYEATEVEKPGLKSITKKTSE